MTSFRHEDALGSLRYLTDGGQNVLGSSVYEAFGAAVGATGSTARARFGFVGGADCQTEADTGLVLMGHRYYDSRIGRFLSQDPAGDGDNWYAYCGNDPINNADPSGLSMIFDPSKAGTSFGGQNDWGAYNAGEWGTYDFFASDGKGGMKYSGTTTLGPTFSDFFMGGGMGTNMGHGMNGGGFKASRQDVKKIKNLLDRAGYGWDSLTDHNYYAKPGKEKIKLPNVHSDGKDHWVVEGLKKRLEREILENQEHEVNDSEPSDVQKFISSRTDGQLAAASVLAAGAIVGTGVGLYGLAGAGAFSGGLVPAL